MDSYFSKLIHYSPHKRWMCDICTRSLSNAFSLLQKSQEQVAIFAARTRGTAKRTSETPNIGPVKRYCDAKHDPVCVGPSVAVAEPQIAAAQPVDVHQPVSLPEPAAVPQPVSLPEPAAVPQLELASVPMSSVRTRQVSHSLLFDCCWTKTYNG